MPMNKSATITPMVLPKPHLEPDYSCVAWLVIMEELALVVREQGWVMKTGEAS